MLSVMSYNFVQSLGHSYWFLWMHLCKAETSISAIFYPPAELLPARHFPLCPKIFSSSDEQCTACLSLQHSRRDKGGTSEPSRKSGLIARPPAALPTMVSVRRGGGFFLWKMSPDHSLHACLCGGSSGGTPAVLPAMVRGHGKQDRSHLCLPPWGAQQRHLPTETAFQDPSVALPTMLSRVVGWNRASASNAREWMACNSSKIKLTIVPKMLLTAA